MLAFVNTTGRVAAVDTGAGSDFWGTRPVRSAPFAGPRQLEWSSDGTLLLLVTNDKVVVFGTRSAAPLAVRSERVVSAAFRPGTHDIAVIRRPPGSQVSQVVLGGRILFSTAAELRGLTWSPDGRWLLVASPQADQWLFIGTADGRIRAVSDISGQFRTRTFASRRRLVLRPLELIDGDRDGYVPGFMEAGQLRVGRRRRDHRRFVIGALAVFFCCFVVGTWPAVRHVQGHYLAGSAPGYGEQSGGDYLQLVWNYWLPGHQLQGGHKPWLDPYSFQPESEVRPNLQGWLLGLPFWPLERAFGTSWAYDLVLLLTFLPPGGFTCWWLRSLGLARAPAVLGGVLFALAPYRVQQSTGHLLGQISFLLPGMLLALERRRFLVAAAALAAIPLSGQVHLALGAIPLFVGYAWARLPRWRGRLYALGGAALAIAAGELVQHAVIATSIVAGGRSLGSVRFYSATLSDFVTRSNGNGVERFVFIGWVTPLRRARRARRRLATRPAAAGGLPRAGDARSRCCSRWGRTCRATRRPGITSSRCATRGFPSACCRSPVSRSPHSSPTRRTGCATPCSSPRWPSGSRPTST